MVAPHPHSFLWCMEQADTSARLNATVDRLQTNRFAEHDDNVPPELAAYVGSVKAVTSKNSDMAKIGQFLKDKLNAKDFILLSTSFDKSSIAVALYAGDGIVVKITEKSYHEKRIRPHGVPPVYAHEIGNFQISVFPWVNTENITSADVESLSHIMAKDKLEFIKGDGRPDNVGKLQDGNPVVLDGNAVQFTDPAYETDPRYMAKVENWKNHMAKSFPHLYSPDHDAYKIDQPLRLRDNPDFTFRFSRADDLSKKTNGVHLSRVTDSKSANEVPWLFP